MKFTIVAALLSVAATVVLAHPPKPKTFLPLIPATSVRGGAYDNSYYYDEDDGDDYNEGGVFDGDEYYDDFSSKRGQKSDRAGLNPMMAFMGEGAGNRKLGFMLSGGGAAITLLGEDTRIHVFGRRNCWRERERERCQQGS